MGKVDKVPIVTMHSVNTPPPHKWGEGVQLLQIWLKWRGLKMLANKNEVKAKLGGPGGGGGGGRSRNEMLPY